MSITIQLHHSRAGGELRGSCLDFVPSSVHVHPHQEPGKWPLPLGRQERAGDDGQELPHSEHRLADRLNEQVLPFRTSGQHVCHGQQELEVRVLIRSLHQQLPAVLLPPLPQDVITELLPRLAEELDDESLVALHREVQLLHLCQNQQSHLNTGSKEKAHPNCRCSYCQGWE